MAGISRVVCAALLLSRVLAQEACAAQDPLCKDAEPGMSYLLQKDKAKAVKDETALAKDTSVRAKMQKQQEEHSAQEQQNQTAEQVQKEKYEQVTQKEGKASEVQAEQRSNQVSEDNKSAWGWPGDSSSSSATSSIPAGCPGASLGGYLWGGFFGSGGDDPACCYGNVLQTTGSVLGLSGGPCTNPPKLLGGEGESCPFGAYCTATPYIPGSGTPVYGYCRCTVGQCSNDGQSCQTSR